MNDPVDYASDIWSGNWKNAQFKNIDGFECRQPTGENLKKNLTAAQKNRLNSGKEVAITNDITLEEIFPNANKKNGLDGPLVLKQTIMAINTKWQRKIKQISNRPGV